ncbi:MAG: Gfo/Idh/MocA family oxidoreductase [Flavisolibacter sp.]|nr:Gfo/Idh/MocA family oxidoreductase [Flavisolibacter sp.]
MKKIRWGILSTAKIGREKVIPAMQEAKYCEVVAIASRIAEQAQSVARLLNIPKAYSSYEELLNDEAIDAIYIPLPNHLHVEWSIKALNAGKHVLCEKPLGASSSEAERLLKAAQEKPQLKVMEAFMYRFHPQWQYVKKLVDDGKVGGLKAIQSFFSYYNVDMNNIRNRKDAAGGAMMDIGCYCISWSRLLFGKEPERVFGVVEYDPRSQTDRLSSGILQFSSGISTFTCSTQLMPYQRVNILGAEARLEVEIPVNAPPDKSTRVWIHSKNGSEEVVFDATNQYTIQGDIFSQAVLDNTDIPLTLEDSINNMRVIEAVFESAEKNSWKELNTSQVIK